MGTRAGLAYPEGNPGALTAAAGRMSDLASRIDRASASIAEGTRVPGWEGHRYGVFIAAGRALANALEPGGAALRRASSDLTQLATQLKDAQRRIDDWADEIEAAQKRFHAAGTALNAAMFSMPFATGSSTSAPDSGKLGRAQAAYQKAGSELEDLKAQYVPKARQLCDRLRQEDERTASAVRSAAAAAPQGASVPVAASAAKGGAGTGGGSGPLSFFDFKPNAEAGPANQDGTFGGHATVSLEAILANLHKEFSDTPGVTNAVDGTVGAGAEAAAKAEVGPHGVHVGIGGEAHAGAKGSLSQTMGNENFSFTPKVEGRLGPGADAGAHVDVDGHGVHVDAHLGVSPLIGAGAHVSVDVDPVGLMGDVINAPKNWDKVKHFFRGG